MADDKFIGTAIDQNHLKTTTEEEDGCTPIVRQKQKDVLIPPLQPVSPADIESFTELDLALRSHPEMAREGASVLNNRAIARLVDGLRTFQSIHLGLGSKGAKNQSWPMVKIPDEIFRDRTIDGPLFTAIISSYRSKKDYSWRQFDFIAPKRFQANINLLKRMEQDLIEAKSLVRPVVYLDENIPAQRRGDYINIVERFGGRVITEIPPSFDTGHPNIPTHIVAWDSEEHDKEENLQEEEEYAAQDSVPKLYFRTVAVIDPVAKRGSGSGGIVQSNMADSKKKGGKVKETLPIIDHPMALIHWWYWPSSYDEWVPASEVEDVSDPPAQRPANGPWVVSCRFIRDVAKFNEWGSEADYAIADYEKKVMYFKKIAEEKAKAEAEQLAKVRIATASKVVEKPKEGKKTGSLKIKLSLSGHSNAKTSTERKQFESMNPRQIFIGYDVNGSRLRRTVYDGALRIPVSASHLLHDSLASCLEMDGLMSEINKKPRTLPTVDSFLRPSVDPNFATKFTVVELRQTESGGTMVNNRTFKAAQQTVIPRLRGGGYENDDVSMTDVEKDVSLLNSDELNNIEGDFVNINGADVFGGTLMTNDTVKEQIDTVTSSNGEHVDVRNLPTEETKNQLKVSDQGQESTVNTIGIQVRENDSNEPIGPESDDLREEVQEPDLGDQQESEQPSDDAEKDAKDEDQKSGPTQANETHGQSLEKTSPSISRVKIYPLAKVLSSSAASDMKPPLTAEQEPTVDWPSWYDANSVSTFEKAMLPEWFNSSAAHRTPSSYVQTREKILDLARENSHGKYITATTVRRSVPGDIGSLIRLHTFLVTFGFINGSALGETQPTDLGFLQQQVTPITLKATDMAVSDNEINPQCESWSIERRRLLATAVVKNTKKRKRIDGQTNDDFIEDVQVDWAAVSKTMGGEMTPFDCQRNFLSLKFDDDSKSDGDGIQNFANGQSHATFIEPEHRDEMMREDWIHDLVDKVNPNVVSAAIDAALQAADGNLAEVANGALLGIVASEAMQRAREHEGIVGTLILQLLEQRMQKLENRLSSLDDIEALLDCERIALELERRDLDVNEIRRDGSFIYEQFLETQGTDVKMCTLASK